MRDNKLGLNLEKVSTNPHTLLSTNRKMSPEEYQIVQNEVDFIYSEFLNRVSEGRGMSLDQVNEVARGRVWTGPDALRLGLVDTLGGIQDAIAYAAKEAGIEKPVVRYYPKMDKDQIGRASCRERVQRSVGAV